MKKEYLGHEISLDSNCRFLVTGPMFEHFKVFDTYQQAIDAIDASKKLEAKNGVPNMMLSVIPEDGNGTLHIKGIHSNTSRLLFVDKPEKDWDTVYPIAPGVRNLLIRRAKLEAEVSEINKRIYPVQISTNRGYGRIATVEKLIEKIDRLKVEYDEKLKLAIKMESK